MPDEKTDIYVDMTRLLPKKAAYDDRNPADCPEMQVHPGMLMKTLDGLRDKRHGIRDSAHAHRLSGNTTMEDRQIRGIPYLPG